MQVVKKRPQPKRALVLGKRNGNREKESNELFFPISRVCCRKGQFSCLICPRLIHHGAGVSTFCRSRWNGRVAKASQGLIPQPFLISYRKIKNEFLLQRYKLLKIPSKQNSKKILH